MVKEIERKFLLRELPDLHNSIQLHIEQGYYGNIRIRKQNQMYFLTIKGPGTLIRTEVEFPLTDRQFQELWKLTEKRIKKTRYVIPVGNIDFFIDIFHGSLEGLVLAEVELEFADQEIMLPYWVGDEVTGREDYQNFNLAKREHL